MKKSNKKPASKKPVDWSRWVRRMGIAMLLVVTVIGFRMGSSAIFQADRWPINVVKVTGQLRYTDPAMIESVVFEQVSGGFFALDMARLQQSVEALEWVAKADARRRWPDTVQLEVNEHVAFGRWGDSQLISSESVVYRSERRQRFDHLPQLTGPVDQKQRVLENFHYWSDRLGDVGLQLAEVELDVRGAWKLVLASGTRLKLGTAKTRQRLERFTSVYARHFATAERNLKAVDLRYTNGMAVTWGAIQPQSWLRMIGTVNAKA